MNKYTLLAIGLLWGTVTNSQKVMTFNNPVLVPVNLERISKTVMEVPEEAPDLKAGMVEHDNESLHNLISKPNPNALPIGPDPALQREYNRD